MSNLLKTCEFEIWLTVMHIFLRFQYKCPFQQEIKHSYTEWLSPKENSKTHWSHISFSDKTSWIRCLNTAHRVVQARAYCAELSQHSINVYNGPHAVWPVIKDSLLTSSSPTGKCLLHNQTLNALSSFPTRRCVSEKDWVVCTFGSVLPLLSVVWILKDLCFWFLSFKMMLATFRYPLV